MIGVYRFLLASFVISVHIWRAGPVPFGIEAVFSFYVLSGYLMTLVLNESYGFGSGNFMRFVANRYLRLYPAYLLMLLIITTHILFIGPLDQLYDSVRLPVDVHGQVANLAILGLSGFTFAQRPEQIMIPNTWSLGVEVFSYLLLGLYFARSARRAVVMLAAGVAITGIQIGIGVAHGLPQYDFQNHYSVVQAGLIPFAIGSLAYFFRAHPALKFGWTKFAALVTLWIVNGLAGMLSDFHAFVTGLYVAAVINFLLVPAMFDFDARIKELWWTKLLGRISYPMFVAHIPVATLIMIHVGGFAPMTFPFFVTGWITTVAFSIVVSRYVERPVERLRRRVKAGDIYAAEPASP